MGHFRSGKQGQWHTVVCFGFGFGTRGDGFGGGIGSSEVSLLLSGSVLLLLLEVPAEWGLAVGSGCRHGVCEGELRASELARSEDFIPLHLLPGKIVHREKGMEPSGRVHWFTIRD